MRLSESVVCRCDYVGGDDTSMRVVHFGTGNRAQKHPRIKLYVCLYSMHTQICMGYKLYICLFVFF